MQQRLVLAIAFAAGLLVPTAGPRANAAPAFRPATGPPQATGTAHSSPPGTDTAYPPFWLHDADTPFSAFALAATTGTDGLVYVLGGSNNSIRNFKRYSLAYAYDAMTGTWQKLPSLPKAMYGIAAAGADGRIYMIAGAGVEAYDPATRLWTARASMPRGAYATAAATGPDGLIYTVGTCPCHTLNVYNPATNTWAALGSAPPAAWWAPKTLTTGADGRLYLLMQGVLYSYDTIAKTWQKLPGPLSIELNYALVGLPNGSIIAIGQGVMEQEYHIAAKKWSFVAGLVWPMGFGNFFAAALAGEAPTFGHRCQPPRRRSSTGHGLYGPVAQLGPASGAVGTTTTLSGTNFAPNATVSVFWGTAVTGTLLATGTTSASGALIASIALTVPKVSPGDHAVTAVESSVSGYPVHRLFAVTAAPPAWSERGM